jgi:hypothetical protein
VTATFYVFHPAMVERALPDAWQRATPADVLAARLALARDTLRAALSAGEVAGATDVTSAGEVAGAVAGSQGDAETSVADTSAGEGGGAAVGGDGDDGRGGLADPDRLAAVADLVAGLAQRAPQAGRPLGAAHAALPVPDDPLLRLWWAATVLRENRGDGHVAALLTAGIDPCEALVAHAASGAVGPDGARVLQASRKWPDEDWAAATDRLRDRGWLDADGQLSPVGREARRGIEALTDHTAGAALAGLGAAGLDALERALAPITAAIVAAGALPRFNPIGLDAGAPVN